MNAAKKAEKEQEKEQMPDFMKKAEEYFSNNRKIFLWNQVDDESAGKIVKQLLYLDSLSHDDIIFFINSPGGVISAVLLTAGAKGKRYAWPSARIMIHQPLIQGQMEGPASDIKIQAEEMLRIRSITTSIIAKTSGKTIEEVDRDTERDNFMSADEDKAYGLIDEVKSIL